VTDSDLDSFLSGRSLYGDDFTDEQIAVWYSDEIDAYADLGARDRGAGRYMYHGLNIEHGFRHLPTGMIGSVLGLGSAYVDEFTPILDRLTNITVIEPAASLRVDALGSLPVRYVEPVPSGTMSFDDGTFDMAVALGTLHHIANVSHVVGEIARVVKVGGYVLIREPIISMGDWRTERRGLTRHERGIPLAMLRSLYSTNGLRIIKETPCMFALSSLYIKYSNRNVYNSRAAVNLDAILCRLFLPNYSYHAIRSVRKLRPTSVFHVLQRQPGEDLK
jgi:SAM-dependent methyltransferase